MGNPKLGIQKPENPGQIGHPQVLMRNVVAKMFVFESFRKKNERASAIAHMQKRPPLFTGAEHLDLVMESAV